MMKGRRKNRINLLAMLIISIILLITFFVIYFLQANIFPFMTIAGIVPNLFVIFILFTGLYANSFLAITFGVFVGFWIDSIYGSCLGITSACLTIIGFIASWFDSLWSKDEKISIIIMVIVSTILFEMTSYFLKSIILEFEFELLPFLKILAIECLYNVLLTIIFFKPFKKLGYKMERNLKRNNMYTVEL